MTLLSGLGILLSLVFGCLLFALVAELYYLVWWKKQRILRNSNTIQADYGNQKNEFYLFCWEKPCSMVENPELLANHHHVDDHPADVELGLGKDLLLKALGEDGVESEIMRLAGPPRFLFTIKEETNEDMESDDGRSMAGGDDQTSRKGPRKMSLGDILMNPEPQSSPFLSPLASPPLKLKTCSSYENPLFESSLEAEFNRLRSSPSSPPPKFKFLRDAEEKLYRKLLEEAQKSRILHEFSHSQEERESRDGSSLTKSKVLPLASSPPPRNSLSLDHVESKPSLHR